MNRVYRYRLSPTHAQDAALRGLLARLRELYNAALQERRDAYRRTGTSPSCRDQQKSLIEVREVRPEYAEIHVHLLQDTLTRLDRAFQAFFRRCKTGEKPGYPRFKGRDRYRTFTFKDAGKNNGAKIVAGGNRLRLTGIGNVKIKLHRPWEGRVKQISVTLCGDGHWYAAVLCDQVPVHLLPATGREVGLDAGLTTFMALSDGTLIENPRPLKTAQGAVARAQRTVSRRKRGSHRRRKAIVLLAKRHAKVARVRRDHHAKTAHRLVREYDVLVREDLNIKGLTRGFLARPVHDAGWGQFFTILDAKAESAGRLVIAVNPSGTSQNCSGCHREVRKDLSVRVHVCPSCGLVLDRDVNAARNILRLGQSLRGGAGLLRPLLRSEKPPPRAVAQVGV